MEDLLYRGNVLAQRACPVCGTDRARGRRGRATTRVTCGAPLIAREAFVRVHALGAKAACSIARLKAIPGEGGPESLACPWCGSRWPGAEVPVRACGMCAAPLTSDVGFVAFLRAGRIRTFCDAACLGAHLARPHPLCA